MIAFPPTNEILLSLDYMLSLLSGVKFLLIYGVKVLFVFTHF